MRFLLDANLPRSAAEMISGLGHEVAFARDIGLASATDEAIAARARASGAALVTRDLDFANIRSYPPESFSGLVVLRLPEHAVATDIVELLRRFLKDAVLLTALPGRLAVVELDRVRFRPALP